MSTHEPAAAVFGKELRAEIERAANSPRTTVLLSVERGMPVRDIARAVHELSPRRGFVFAELEPRGADAARLHERLSETGKGTLHAVDVARWSPAAQERLAQLLEERREDSKAAGARLIASVSGDPERAVERGELREDLHYRLNGHFLRPRPLRDRVDELAELAHETISRLHASGAAPRLSRAALAELRGHSWPGNERELELVLERALLLWKGGELLIAPFGAREADPVEPDELSSSDRSLRAAEGRLIRRVLAEQGGNKSRAASILGLHRATLHQKLRALGVQG